jgi:hypothetical protein
MRVLLTLPLLLVLGLSTLPSSGCASTQIQKVQQVSVDLHAILAAVDDAEMALCNKQIDGTCKSVVPAWTTDKHKEFSTHMVLALKAGRAVNEAVRTAPVSTGAKIDLLTVSSELETLTSLIVGVLPPGHAVAIALTAAKDAVLKILPLFLQ